MYSWQSVHLCYNNQQCMASVKQWLTKEPEISPDLAHHITMTSWLARWRLKSPASRLFTQLFIEGADQRKHQSSASLAFVRGIHRWPVNSPHERRVKRKCFHLMTSSWPCDIWAVQSAMCLLMASNIRSRDICKHIHDKVRVPHYVAWKINQ